MRDEIKQKLEAGSHAILAIAGISHEPQPGSSAAGVSRHGSNVYTQEQLANSDDIRAGAGVLHSLAALIMPFGVLGKKEKDALNKMASASGNQSILNTLDDEASNRRAESFIATILKAVNSNGRHALGVLAATKLYDHWGVMSPAQKSIAIAVLAVQTHVTDKGSTVCDLPIIEGPDEKFYVRDALDLFIEGKNPYPVVEYWEQITDLLEVYGAKKTPEIVSDFAISHKLVGISINGAAVPGISKDLITQNGGKHAPQYGVGALAIPKGKASPQGYSNAANIDGGSVIVPTANANSAAGALLGSLAGTRAGKDGISGDAFGTYSKWNKADKKQADKGMDGGSQLIAGISAFKNNNPYLYGVAVALLAKHSNGEIDSSTPVKYFVSLAGLTLARLVSGKKEKQAEKEGMAIAHQVLANSPAEFAKIQINIRALFANFGVSSKADGYQLTNQAYAEDRIDETDLVAMHETLDIIYSQNGLAAVQKLMNGKDKGLEIARAPEPETINTMEKSEKERHKKTLASMTKEEARKRNAARYAKQQAQQQETGENPQEEQAETPQQETGENAAETPAGQLASGIQNRTVNSLEGGGTGYGPNVQGA